MSGTLLCVCQNIPRPFQVVLSQTPAGAQVFLGTEAPLGFWYTRDRFFTNAIDQSNPLQSIGTGLPAKPHPTNLWPLEDFATRWTTGALTSDQGLHRIEFDSTPNNLPGTLNIIEDANALNWVTGGVPQSGGVIVNPIAETSTGS